MSLFSRVLSELIKTRLPQVELFINYPHEVQHDLFNELVRVASNTEWGKKYDYSRIKTPEDFKQRVPLNSYDDLRPYIELMRQGQPNILWPSKIRWFSKSSGTTSEKSKFIPVSHEALHNCHYKAGKDMLAVYCSENPHTKLFSGKTLGMTGTHNYFSEPQAATYFGDISAILLQHLPFWAQLMRVPERNIALMSEWEEKLGRMADAVISENMVSISGVPSWMLLLLKQILEKTKLSNIAELWPNLELFVHGGVNFEPYQEQFSKILPAGIFYLDAYNASEGFFAFQATRNKNDMLLLLNHGIFYEFIPIDQIEDSQPEVLQLHQVVPGQLYALVISTNAGLWRYVIGDTVKFTSVNPYYIRIAGRTKHFINAVGEELMVENADAAIAYASKVTRSVVAEYTASPVYFGDKNNAAHQWLVEFEQPPSDLKQFIQELDKKLMDANSDYEAKRYHDLILRSPIVQPVPKNTFYNWMKLRGKLGGQNKVPRLANNRKYVDEILTMLAAQ